MKVPKLKYAVGSVAQAAAKGADTLLSEARKDVVAARGKEPAMPKEMKELGEAVSKVKGSAETEAPKIAAANIKETVKLVNSFKFQGGNKKMDKQYIMESLNEVSDTPIIESKQAIAEFITDLHRTQMDEESKPLLASTDFEKLGEFVEREAKNEGGEVGDSDVDKLIMFSKDYEEQYGAAKTDKSRATIDKRFNEIKDSFDDETIFQAMVKMNDEEGREGKFGGGLLASVFSKVLGSSGAGKIVAEGQEPEAKTGIIGKIVAKGQLPEAITGITKMEGPDPIEPSNNKLSASAPLAARGTTTAIGYAEGGSLLADDTPVDTYDNIPEDEKSEVKASQLPDDEMEDEYAEHVMDEALTPEDQEYLLSSLEGDDKLGDIFDKIMDTAGVFAGNGAVEGPGTGTSDSIPARLSDGEFVFTRKATDQIGTEKLQAMMDDAERAYDGGLIKEKDGGALNKSILEMEDPDKGVHGQMLSANAMPSVN